MAHLPATPSLLFPSQSARNRTSLDHSHSPQSTLRLFVLPPASIVRAVGKFLSVKTGPGSGQHRSSRSSSNDRYDDSDGYPIHGWPEPPSAVEHSLALATKHKHQTMSSDQPDVPSQPNFPTSAKVRSRIAIENLIDRHKTASPSSIIETRKRSSTGPFESGFSVGVSTAVSKGGLPVENYVLEIRQQPPSCIAFSISGRNVVTPAPTIELTIHDGDPHREWLQSPFFFVGANLYDPVLNTPIFRPLEETLVGSLVSSLHRVRNQHGREKAYFIFDDLTIKLEGQFCLQFNLFEMVEGAQFEFITSTLSDIFRVYLIEQFSGVCQASDEIAMARHEVLNPTVARSEGATESNTPSSTTTATTVTAAMPSPTAKRQKIGHKMEISESDRVDDAIQIRRKRSARSNVSATSFGLAVPSIYSTRISKRRTPSRNRRPARSSREKRAEATDINDRKNYYYDGPHRHVFLKLSYSPREEHQYYVPAPRPPRPPPPPATHLQQYEDNYQTTATGMAPRPPHSLSRRCQQNSKSTMQQVGHSRTSLAMTLPAYHSSMAPQQPQQPQLQQHTRLPLSPTGLQLSMPPLVPRFGPKSLMHKSGEPLRLPPLVFGDLGVTAASSRIRSSLPPSAGANIIYTQQHSLQMSFDSAKERYAMAANTKIFLL
ncbi:velvet factor-domain-containing protein [Lipomyces doorenjongii]|uniref:velvet factor-domain-containing protein n=1 Tax=Lipomyces doorenjongii TaxID=383834 RepID=UPI0034CD458B